MEPKQISINEVLRHTMHDFLNNLHLIQMNLDMGRHEEAKTLIRTYSQKCTQFFDVNNIGLYNTNEWLQTFSMEYNKVSLEVQTILFKRGAEQYDSPLKDYLKRFIDTIYPLLKGYQEQILSIRLYSHDVLEVQVELVGEWTSYTWIDESFTDLFRVEKEMNTESRIKFKLIATERLE
ncbi:Spo0B domain-containing protein [Psychrobacillus sp. L3]|uniref:Spo0B domain-containing protein n=1 Tax=Psychrobacillus sp. L3 TaxID=3236891 RepID=UPI0036F1C7F7